jgi:hypothetical protein
MTDVAHHQRFIEPREIERKESRREGVRSTDEVLALIAQGVTTRTRSGSA